MGLSVETPDPPELEAIDPNEYGDADVAADADYRREELQAFLEDGAWEQAFDQWVADTDLDEAEWEVVRDLGLLEEFDFFWDDFADRVGYHSPGIPEDWKQRNYHDNLETWGSVSAINAELAEFGQVVCEVLKADYIDWESDFEPDGDLPDF